MPKKTLVVLGAAANSAIWIIAFYLQKQGIYGIGAALLLMFSTSALLTLMCVRWYELSIIDDGTGLYNRRFLFRKLEHSFSTAQRTKDKLTLAVIDIDDFRGFNTKYGHLIGDQVLHEVAACLQSSVRKSDTIGRWGGEEFALMLPGLDAVEGEEVAERIRSRVEKRYVQAGEYGDLAVTVSIGLAVFEGDYRTLRDFINDADHAMYNAKQHKNTVCAARKECFSTPGPNAGRVYKTAQ
ncbi:GGDEF domain-containing protein [Paenibacillus sp. UNC451MF]|uniref:GGDEF domain-containing protein n=1 Tax=Paenibacillus sp. UNC451MF TaxID=1449063 RepID=UPI00068F5D7E|nr:GGDEF domain-containing protein [Paenibacillus sp. UNC451MF]